MEQTSAVKTTNLTKTFSGKEIIRACNMNVVKGTIYGFLGANGAGKTTIFKLISGLLKPTMGKAEIFGKDVASQRESILTEIGTLIDTPIFYEHLSAKENLMMHLAYIGMDNGDLEPALRKVGLTDTGMQSVSTFSLGMRQRLAIARAVIHKPKLLILDEPINGLDPMGIREMRDFFLELVKNQDITILISSHILTEIEHIADTIGVIVEGTIVKEVSMERVKAESPCGLEQYFLDVMAGRREE